MNVVIIGAGVVGQSTGKGLKELGHEVEFVDIRTDVIKRLRHEGYLATDSIVIGDISMFCLPTPYDNDCIDIGAYIDVIPKFGIRLGNINRYHMVVVRSTILPGTMEKIVIPMLEKYSGKQHGRDFGVVYNPEFLRARDAYNDFLNPWIAVFGADSDEDISRLERIYEPQIEKIPRIKTNFRTAEMIKYAHNLFNATKISFSNEIWNACCSLDIDGNEVMKAVSQSAEGMWNPEYGIKGGSPYGGSCLPKDTKSFLAFANEKSIPMKLLQATVEVNEYIGARCKSKVEAT
jgi:UDPglucose 6-dehydrogenase